MLKYFAKSRARPCKESEDPAEYILQIVACKDTSTSPDWVLTWTKSTEHLDMMAEHRRMNQDMFNSKVNTSHHAKAKKFAAPLIIQL